MSDEEIIKRFGDLFSSNIIGPDKTVAERRAEIEDLGTVLEKLSVLPSGATVKMIQDVCQSLSSHAKEFAGIDEATASRDAVLASLSNYRDMSRKYYELSPRTGGRDTHANYLAEAVAYVFKEIKEPVTPGTNKLGDPSTKFGWIVKCVLAHHKVGTKWTSPTRRVAKMWKDGWRP
jgi:hypothetical protein